MNKKDIKRLNGLRREVELEQVAQHGPQHGRAATHRSARDKARCPKNQRKNRAWERDAA